MLKIVLLSALVALVSADVVDISSEVDKNLEIANQILTKKGLGLAREQDRLEAGLLLSGGVFAGHNSLYRTGNATATTENGTTVVDIHVGRRLSVSSWRRITDGLKDFSGVITETGSSFQIVLEFTEKPCKAEIKTLTMENISEALLSATNVDFDKRVITDEHRAAVQHILDKARPIAEKITQINYCRHPKPPHPNGLIGDFIQNLYFNF